MHIVGVMKIDSDNEPDTMIPISLPALELLNRLRTKMALLDLTKEGKNEEENDERSGNDKTAEQTDREDRERLRYFEHRVKELREFERRARGK